MHLIILNSANSFVSFQF